MPPRLTPPEVAHYETEGWVIPAVSLTPGETSYFRGALDELIAANPAIRK